MGVVREAMDQGSRLRLPVPLQVLKMNRGRRLFERLAFREAGETATRGQMVFEGRAG
jgi:hypothetical protein